MSKEYFPKAVEEAIIEYNKTEDPEIRNRIYEEKIYYALFKLTQNLVHTFKFYNTDIENLEDLQHEVIVFLNDRLHMFNPKKSLFEKIDDLLGSDFQLYKDDFFKKEDIESEDITNFINNVRNDSLFDSLELEVKIEIEKLRLPKAFSYFGTIAKNYLILYNQKNYQKKVQSLPIDNIKENDSYENYYSSEDRDISKDKLSFFMDKFVDFCYDNLSTIFKDPIDLKVADAVLELLKQRNNLLNIKKKALYIYIRNMVDVKTPKITKVVTRLYDWIWWPNYISFLEEGFVNFKDYKYVSTKNGSTK